MASDSVSVISVKRTALRHPARAASARVRQSFIIALLALTGFLAWIPWHAEASYRAAAPGAAQAPSAAVHSVEALAWAMYAPQAASSDARIHLSSALLAFLAAALASLLACWAIVRFQHLHARYTLDAVDTGPQKFHARPTPRVGGVGLALGLGATFAFMRLMLGDTSTLHSVGLLLLCGIPAFAGGLIEDLTKSVGVIDRLLLTMLSGAMAAWMLGAVLDRVGIPGVDHIFIWGAVAIPFTIFAVGGVANAINIIDGYNGLVAGYAIIVLLAFALVAYLVGDALVLLTALGTCGAIFGFFALNWPGGKIFLGDGGAYLMGYLLAELSVLIVIRHPVVKPWFPLLLLIYPIFETIFSIYRKKVLRGQSPGTPDGLHLHMLLYKRVVPREWRGRENPGQLCRNSRTAKYIWGPTFVCAAVAVGARTDSMALVFGVAVFIAAYILVYKKIVHFFK